MPVRRYPDPAGCLKTPDQPFHRHLRRHSGLRNQPGGLRGLLTQPVPELKENCWKACPAPDVHKCLPRAGQEASQICSCPEARLHRLCRIEEGQLIAESAGLVILAVVPARLVRLAMVPAGPVRRRSRRSGPGPCGCLRAGQIVGGSGGTSACWMNHLRCRCLRSSTAQRPRPASPARTPAKRHQGFFAEAPRE